ncbi:MAG: hypothetical protein Q8Q12_13590 [bacterium]|nr:hypothetical protein [bacterium]
MRLFFSPLVCCLLALYPFAKAAWASEEISLAKLEVAGWQPTALESYVGKKLYDAIDGYADFHMGFNFKDSERRFFTNGEKRIEVFSYRLDSPENAFGLFSVMRKGAPELLDIGNEAASAGAVFHMWKGAYYITVSDLGKTECTQEEILAFARAVDAQFAGKYTKPALVEALPKTNLVSSSVTYFHYRNALERLTYLGEGNVLLLGEDFDKPYDVEAAYGQFVIDKTKYDLIVFRYDSPKKPETAAKNFVEMMEGDLKTSTTNWPWAELVERNGKQTILFREGNILMLSFPTAKGDVVRDLMKDLAARLLPKTG